jgi:hypothetical protein
MAVESRQYLEWKDTLEMAIFEIGWLYDKSTFTIVPRFLAYGVIFLKLEGETLFEWMYEQIRIAPGFQEHCAEKHRIKSIIRRHIVVNNETEYYNSNGKRRKGKQPFPFGEKMFGSSSGRKTSGTARESNCDGEVIYRYRPSQISDECSSLSSS